MWYTLSSPTPAPARLAASLVSDIKEPAAPAQPQMPDMGGMY